MLLGIDHLVIAVHDPDAAVVALGDDLGISFTGGGRHEAWGTFNRLAFLGDTYLELIGVFDRALAGAESGSAVARATLALLDSGAEGLATFALATDDIEGDVARLRETGSSIGPPLDGSRARPDGEVVRWRTAAAATVGPGGPPFLIEHEYAGAEWGDGARAARAEFKHPAGGRVRLTGLEVPCANEGAVAAAYATTVGLTFDATVDGNLAARVGPHVVRLADDAADPTVDLAGDMRRRLDLVRCGIRWRSVA